MTTTIKHKSGRILKLDFWLFGWWGKLFAPADIGGWTWIKIRPRWFWYLRKIQLWSEIVWRRFDSGCSKKMDSKTAWEVAGIVYDRGSAMSSPFSEARRERI